MPLVEPLVPLTRPRGVGSLQPFAGVLVAAVRGVSHRPRRDERSRVNVSVASNMLGFKVPLFIGQGLLFLWAFSEKGSPCLLCSGSRVIMSL